MGVTLEQLLQSRDRRVQHQRDLLGAYPGKSLLCLTVQLPGAQKRSADSLCIAHAGVEAVREAFSLVYEELRDLETGFEGYFLLEGDPLLLKRRCCRIEDTHPLGRLMDLDILAVPHADALPVPVGREAVGLEPRRCLLCGAPARVCMRTREHALPELLEKIRQMVNSFQNP